MRMRTLLTAAVAWVLALGVAALGADPPSEDGAGGPGRPQPPGAMFEHLVKELGLSAEQQTQVRQILDTHRQALANWQKEHAEERKALHEELRKAREDKDREAMKAAGEKLRALNRGLGELQKGLHDRIAEVLTDEQKKTFEQMARRRRRRVAGHVAFRQALRRLELTEAQQAKVKAILEQAAADAKKVDDPSAKRKVLQDAMESIRTSVLTDAQRAKLTRARARRGPGGPRGRAPLAELDLSDEQKAQVRAILQAARKEAEGAEPEKRREVLRAAMEKVSTTVLTEAQAAKLKELREARRKRWEEMRRKRGGPRGRRKGVEREGS